METKLTIDDLKQDILKLIDKVEELEQKIHNLNWKLTSAKKEDKFDKFSDYGILKNLYLKGE